MLVLMPVLPARLLCGHVNQMHSQNKNIYKYSLIKLLWEKAYNSAAVGGDLEV